MSDNGETPRRLVSADYVRMLQGTIENLTTRTASEPYASANVETTAKMEPKPDVKIAAPVGCDYADLEAHALRVTRIAVTAWRVAMEESRGVIAVEPAEPF